MAGRGWVANDTVGPVPHGLSRRGLLAAGALGALAATTSSCAMSAAASGGPNLPTGDDLVVGASLELTGPASIVGQAQQKALMVAQSRLNGAGGVVVGNQLHRIRLLIEDNTSDPTVGVRQATDLLDRQKVVALLGGGVAATSLAMSAIAEARRAPMISMAAAGAIINPVVQKRFIFKLGPNAQEVSDLMVEKIVAVGAARIGLIYEQTAHGTDGLAALQSSAVTGGTTGTAQGATTLSIVSAEPVPVGNQDDKTAITQVLAAQPDVVVIWAYAPTSGYVAQAIRAAGYQGTMFFDSGAAAEDALSPTNRTAMQGSYLVTPSILGGMPIAVTSPQAINQVDFFQQYSRLYGFFSGLAVYAADAVNLVAAAAHQAETTARVKVRDALEGAPYDGLAGEYIFSTITHGGVDPSALSIFQMQHTGWSQA